MILNIRLVYKKKCIFLFFHVGCGPSSICLNSVLTYLLQILQCANNTDFTVIGWWYFCPLWLLLVLVVLFYNLLFYCCKRDIFQCMFFGNFYWCVLYLLQFSVVNLSDIVKFFVSIKLWIIKYRIDVSVNDSFCFFEVRHPRCVLITL